MIVIPAIDLKDGRCVRLKQGRMNDETVFSEVPQEIAKKWFGLGAERIHVVDLDGAVRGEPVNRKEIKKIVDSVPVPVQLGGGVRDMATLDAYFDLGIEYVILGTVMHKDPEFVFSACDAYQGKIILGIDARQNRVALEGWTEEVDSTPLEMARKFEGIGVHAINYTDIHRDGMRTGPNLEATKQLARAIQIPVIASGGISELHDIIDIISLSEDGVVGMITGRALYEGSLDLAEAIKATKKHSNA